VSSAQALNRDGFVIVPNVISARETTDLIDVVTHADFARSTRGEDTYGARNILAIPQIKQLAVAPQTAALVSELIGEKHLAVRGIFFDKPPGANWPVAWHQDLSLAVSDRSNVEGWGKWSIKAGIQHVQPPASVLEQMVTLRIQLDDSDADNGPLRVIAGSHRLGRLSADRIKSIRGEASETTCTAPAGSALAMKPLIVHASSAAKSPHHRRVIHIEYAPINLLPAQLEWAFADN
jgi:ectoine hydroxylase-related dioxygenase (phytanoyl-CoA dioxygenase family)